MNTDASDTPQDPADQAAGWAALGEHAEDLVQAAQDDDEEGSQAAIAALTQQAAQLDVEAFINTVHVPADAGQYAQQLAAMMERIPENYGRWIECEAGWYPLLTQLDSDLLAIVPQYRPAQIKQKYGALQFSCSYGEEFQNPADPKPETPKHDAFTDEASKDAAWADWKQLMPAWRERLALYIETPVGAARLDEYQQRLAQADQLVKAAQQQAEVTCEKCGDPGEMTFTLSAEPWYQVLCPAHAQAAQAVTGEAWDEWWREEEPRFDQRMRDYHADRQQGRRSAVITADTTLKMSFDTEYVHTSQAAVQAAADTYDDVWVGNDAVGEAYIQAIIDRYADHIAAERIRMQPALDAKEYISARTPDGFPWLYYLHRRFPDREAIKFLAGSLSLSQPYHFLTNEHAEHAWKDDSEQ